MQVPCAVRGRGRHSTRVNTTGGGYAARLSVPAVFADRQGRRALAASASQLTLAVVVAGLFVSGLPGFVQHLAGVCQFSTRESAELTPEKVSGLAAAGLTPLAYATWLALLLRLRAPEPTEGRPRKPLTRRRWCLVQPVLLHQTGVPCGGQFQGFVRRAPSLR